MNLKCVIIDDEPHAINVIKNYIHQIKGLQLVKTFNNAIDSLEYLHCNGVDLLFLDINMPILDGYNFLDSIENKPMVIITTANEEYAVKGYELEVLYYLLKPFPIYLFIKAINRAFKKFNEIQYLRAVNIEREYIFVKVDKKKMKKIFLDEILVIESIKDYIKIRTASNKYIVHQTLNSFTESLPSKKFIRIHRSFTISVDKVESVEGNSLELAGNRYTIGRSYLFEVKNVIFKSAIF
jgi:DNA-binding LytR/AlgR family response regulator